MTAVNPLLTAALEYADRGWPVFPCHPGNKRPLVAGDKDAEGKAIPKTGGVKKATTDRQQIRDWWKRWPNALIGCATGVAFNVVDFDPRTDDTTGEVFTLERLKADVEAQIGAALPKTLHSITQSGGVHLFFALPDDGGAPITNRGNLPLHVDVRGRGGYVIVPPSVMESGKLYRWRGSPSTPIAPMPAELVAVLRTPGKDIERPPASTPPASVAPSSANGSDAGDDAVRKYALAAADAEVRALAGTGDGGRNNALNASAYALGQLVGAQALSEGLARSMLLEVARQWPNIAKSEGTIESGLSSGKANPRDLSEVREKTAERARYAGKPRGRVSAANTAAAPAGEAGSASDDASPPPHPPQGSGSEETSQMGGSAADPGAPEEEGRSGEQLRCDRIGAFLPRTDLGNAERWVLRHGDNFRYCPAIGWLAWDNRRWSRDDADRLLSESIFDTVRGIQFESDWLASTGCAELGVEGGQDFIVKWVGPKDDKRAVMASETLASWGRTSEGSRSIQAIRTLGQPKVTVRLEIFDADPWLFNVANGTLVFNRGDRQPDGYGVQPSVHLKPHDRSDLITMLAPVEYRPGEDGEEPATCPTYDKFFEEVQPDADIRRFLMAWAGYSLTGDAGEQKFVINHGASGQNGKGVWIDTLASIMGDYAMVVPIEVFLDQARLRSSSGPSPDLAELPRKRMVRTSEASKGRAFAESLIKVVTGGEPMRARHLNMPFFEFMPEFKITVSMNPIPELSEDPAIWRRVRIVPWTYRVPDGKVDPELAAKIRGEASGVLNRVIAGLLDWCANGLPESDAVKAATAQVRDLADPVARFLKAACAVVDDERVNSTELYRVFKAWAIWAGEKEWSQKGFSGAMSNRGFEKIQSNTVFFIGLRLVRTVGDFVSITTAANGSEVWKARKTLGDDDPVDGHGSIDPPTWEDRGED